LNTTTLPLKARPALGIAVAFIVLPFLCLAQISGPSITCLNQEFAVSISQPESGVKWDFCEGDLALVPTLHTGTAQDFNIPVGTALIQADDKWYGFVTSLSNNSIIRLDFGISLLNTSPTITNLGNIGGLLNGPQEIKVIEYQSNFYAFVFNKNVNKLVRINLGTNLQDPTTSATAIVTGGGFDNGGLDVVFDGANWIASITNSTTLTIVNLGASPANNPPVENIVTTAAVPNANGIADVRFVRDGGLWYGFIVAYSSWTIHRLDFGSSISNVFTTATKIATLSAAPYGLVVEHDNGKWTMLTSTLQGKFYRLDLGTVVTNGNPTLTNLGNLGSASNTLKIDAVNTDSRWVALVANWNSKNFYMLHFPQGDCGFDQVTSAEESPSLISKKAGTYYITGTQWSSDQQVRQSKLIEVQDKAAPQLSFSTTSLCENVAGTFQANADQALTDVSWNFFGSGLSTDDRPIVSFPSAGSYTVELTGISENGCTNLHRKSIEVYEPLIDVADFDIPSTTICTNNELIFTNNSVDNYDGNLTFKWFVDESLVSEQRDLEYTFAASQSHVVKLRASIPGCFDEAVEPIANIAEGPLIDFSFTGVCHGSQTHFFGQLPEGIASYYWSFPDGTPSGSATPSIIFSSPSEYSVALTAVSQNGCSTTKTKAVTIYATPKPDFSVGVPPESCSGRSTPFLNHTPGLSDSQIQFWNWNFGDPNSASNFSETPAGVHAYATAGTYTVELKAKTNYGCEGVTQKQITIAQSPEATFSNSATCVGVAASFTSTGSDIKNWYWEIGTAYYLSKSIGHTFNATGEQNVKLTVTGNNNCNMSLTRKVTIPVPLVPAFSVSKNCKGYEAEFVDNTSGNDPIVWRQWDVGGTISSNTEQVKYTLSNTDALPAALTVKTQSGCTYSKKVDVKIWKAPVAKFTVTPITGAIPLNIQIDNLSEEASIFNWTFEDGSVSQSTAFEPDFSFTTIGEHKVELKATNEAGCETIASKIVTAELPWPDAEIKLITLSQNPDKSLKVIITILNSGNTIINNLPVKIDISGDLLLRETIKGPVLPGEQYNLVLSYGIAKSQDLEFLCAQTELANDQTLIGNRSCIQFEQKSLIMSPYPNPATEVLNIEWLSTNEHTISIMITDGFGKALLQKEVDSIEGMNQQFFDVHELKAGIYFLVINDGSTIKTQRILISPKN
jgi:PKD repeat protein